MNKKRVILIGIIVVIIVALIIAIVTYIGNKRTEVISTEIENAVIALSTSNEIDKTTKTTGDYMKLEQYIKDELSTVSTDIKSFKTEMDAIEIGDTLRPEKLESDLPKLTKSKENTSKAVEHTQKVLNDIKLLTDFDSMVKNMDEKGISKNNQKVYKKVMSKNNLNTTISSIIKGYETKLEIYTNLKDIVDFLDVNKDKWEIDGTEFKMRDADKLIEYNKLLDKLKASVNK